MTGAFCKVNMIGGAVVAAMAAVETLAVEMTAEETPAEICKEHHKRKK